METEMKIAKVKTLFYSSDDNNKTSIDSIVNYKNELFIEINSSGSFEYICLDKETAIEFVKELNNLIKQM